MKLATLYNPATGEIACTTSIQLPLGIDPDEATVEQWAEAIAALEAAAGMPCIIGEPLPNQRVEDGVFVDIAPLPPAAPPVPSVVTMRQARLALLSAEKLDDVGVAIASLPSPQKEAAQIEWEYAATVERNSALMGLVALALGLDDPALDDLFTAAALL